MNRARPHTRPGQAPPSRFRLGVFLGLHGALVAGVYGTALFVGGGLRLDPVPEQIELVPVTVVRVAPDATAALTSGAESSSVGSATTALPAWARRADPEGPGSGR